MAENRRRISLDVVLFVVLSLAAALPILIANIQIGIDTPAHLSMVRILRLAFEDPVAFHKTYAVRLWQPYWGYYAPVLLLSTLLPLDLAAKLVTALMLVGVPVAAGLLAKREGLRPTVALPAFALCYNFTYLGGFLPFHWGLTSMLFGLLMVLRYGDAPGRRNLVFLWLVSLGVFISHVMAWLLFSACSGWLLAVRKPRLAAKPLLWGASAFAFPALLLVLWNRSFNRAGNYSWVIEHPLVHSFGSKAHNLPHFAFASVDSTMEVVLLALWGLLLVLGMMGPWDQARKWRCARWGGLTLAMFAGYWAIPQDFHGLSYFYQRLLLLTFLFALLCAPAIQKFRLAYAIVGLAVVVFELTFGMIMLSGFNRQMTGAQACLSRARPGSNLMGLMLVREPPLVRYPFFLHADSYHAYWNLGRVYSDPMEQITNTPVFYKKPAFHRGPIPVFEWMPQTFQIAYAQNVDYFLIHAPFFPPRADLAQIPTDRLLLKQAFADSSLVCSEGQWRLYAYQPGSAGGPATPSPMPTAR